LPRDFCRLLGLGCPKQAFAKIVARLKDFDITIKDIAETPTGINLLGPLSGAILPKTSSFSDNYWNSISISFN